MVGNPVSYSGGFEFNTIIAGVLFPQSLQAYYGAVL
jgi:hypothetical protein